MMRRLLATAAVGLGAILVLQGGWIQAKAWLAQQLLQQAWAATLEDGQPHRPWPWADHWPVASLQLPGRAQPLIVLEGDQGHALAFGPGHNAQSGLGADRRSIVISAHRDTHFRGLAQLQPGAELVLRIPSGVRRFAVHEHWIADADTQGLAIAQDGVLYLVTCLTEPGRPLGGSRRLVLRAPPTGDTITVRSEHETL